jgi:tetratricopeptide (TPR) repeat protein
MRWRCIAIPLCLGLLAGCASAPPTVALPWRDADFAHDPALVKTSKAELFRLDAALVAELRAATDLTRDPRQRSDQLVALLFDRAAGGFTYAAGHSTPAMQTWTERRGDCLSLTVLTYALARAAGVDAHMQEVRVPALLDRRGNIDFLNRHVNVLVRLQTPTAPGRRNGSAAPALVIDFEPAVGSFREGTPLSDDAILARYYNNLAVEHYARGEDAAAYAHFKAAIGADPRFAPSYGNLAQLYVRRGYAAEAEQLLRQAVALTDAADLSLWRLHQLLLAQGRSAEAAQFEALLHTRRERDPYYWLGVGVERLRARDYGPAIAALQRAQSMSQGFDEVHRYLALAYWRAGETRLAQEQLAVLAGRGLEDPAYVALRAKFDRATAQ